MTRVKRGWPVGIMLISLAVLSLAMRIASDFAHWSDTERARFLEACPPYVLFALLLAALWFRFTERRRRVLIVVLAATFLAIVIGSIGVVLSDRARAARRAAAYHANRERA